MYYQAYKHILKVELCILMDEFYININFLSTSAYRLWYVGFLVVPPLYPTLVCMTPGTQPNCASGCQNHANPKLAFSKGPSNGGLCSTKWPKLIPGCKKEIFLVLFRSGI